MKHFTTPEQSKLLLELGVPADSADCIYSECADVNEDGVVSFDYTDRELLPIKTITGEQMAFSEYKEKYTNGYVLPCWSVGSLIEIYRICVPYDRPIDNPLTIVSDDIIGYLIKIIERDIDEGYFEFEELEE